MANKKELLRRLLKGIETGDAAAAAVVNEAKYIQHNPQTHEGSEGLAVLFARLSKTNPKVKFMRVFEDGDYAFAHNEYDFASVRAAFEVFRFEDGRAVEHWDNIQPLLGPNCSGRGMLDGSVDIEDLHKTEANRATVKRFVQDVLIASDFGRLSEFVAADLIQHNPDFGDGCEAYRDWLMGDVSYLKNHKNLAEGNFVLSMNEGQNAGAPTAFYDLFRLDDDKIVEHWGTIETIAPKSEWKNDNGKF